MAKFFESFGKNIVKASENASDQKCFKQIKDMEFYMKVIESLLSENL